jgi:ATP-dependent Lhr-like helicase
MQAINPIHDGTHCLLLAPTAGGKTEAAALPVLSRMLLSEWQPTSVLYVCPIKALLNNLEHRLTHYAGLVGRTVQVWHGDVSAGTKRRAIGDRKDILLTTPESLEGLLVSPKVERDAFFGQLRAVVIDELHAFAADDRGWHLRSILHRLDQYAPEPLQRIGLSATVSNPDQLLQWLAPTGERQVVGSASVSTDADVLIDHVGNLDNASTVISRMHRGEKRLVFCDSRAGAEQIGANLRTAGIRTFVSHASLGVSERRAAETAFAEEKDCVIVATSTLELGIDVGDLDRVIQLDAPGTVSSFLQRMGRTGRRAGARRNCLFLTTSDTAFLTALGVATQWSRAWVEAAYPPPCPWHIVAQQAMTVALERGAEPLHSLRALLGRCFPESASTGIADLLTYMVKTGYLLDDGGLIAVGPTMEAKYGRGHYRDILASFSAPALLVARHGNQDIGYIDPSALSATPVGQRVLLAGRSWLVTGVDWKRRLAWLEPSADKGKARWIGSSRGLGREIAEAVRSALCGDISDHVGLSSRATDQLARMREEFAVSPDGNYVVTREGDEGRTWTFAGTVENRRLAKLAEVSGHAARFDAFSVRTVVNEAPDNADVVITERVSAAELSEYAEELKFSEAIPAEQLKESQLARRYRVLPETSNREFVS